MEFDVVFDSATTFYRKRLAAYSAVLTCLWALSTEAIGQEQLFRYKNDSGVVVIGYSIPPAYAQKGYEIISTSGKLIDVVPPAPTEEELSVSRAKRELIEAYKKLQLRYSRAEDIHAARDRRLAGIQSNIDIVSSNINGLEIKLAEQLKNAAQQERVSGKASKSTINQIATTRAELAIAKNMLKTRSEEYKSASKKYEDDIELFAAGQVLTKQQGDVAP